MNKKIDLDLLRIVQSEINIEKINQIFQVLLNGLKTYLNLEPVNSNVKIIYSKDNNFNTRSQEIFSFGTNRSVQNNCLIIEISDLYKKYLPIILLREAFNCFVPDNLKQNKIVNTVINQIIEKELQELKVIKEWSSFINQHLVNYDFISKRFDRFGNFINLQGTDKVRSPAEIFFEYIRKNVLLITDIKEDFYDDIFKEFVFKHSISMKNDDVIETIRVLINIFYKVKHYRALLDYQDYFKKFKKSGEIQTDLSLRKFSNYMQWINRKTYIAPSYHIIWNAFDICVLVCTLRFNPLLTKEKIDQVIEKLPFFVYSKSSENNFAVEFSGFFIAPQVFKQDIIKLFKKLVLFSYIIKKVNILETTYINSLNLNYFREFHKKRRIINVNHKSYDKRYEIKCQIDEYKDFYNQRLSLLDFLILRRVSCWSTMGFRFQRRRKILKNLKQDYFNEIICQQTLINNLKNNIELIRNNQELKDDLLNFLNSNENFGFFYIEELIKNLLTVLELIENILSENKNIKNIYQIREFIKKFGISQRIEDNSLFNKKHIRKIIFRDFISLYFKNKSNYYELVEKYRIFANFFKNCLSLTILDLKAIKKVIEDKNMGRKIYSTKKSKLKNCSGRKKIKNIANKDIDSILDGYINSTPQVIQPELINTINTTSFAKYFIILLLKKSTNSLGTLDILKSYFPRIVLFLGVDDDSKEELIQVEIYLPDIHEKDKELFVSIIYNLFKNEIISLRRYFWDGFFKSFSRSEYYNFDRKEFYYTKDLFEQYFIYVQKIFGRKLKPFKKINSNCKNLFWSSKKNMNDLINRNFKEHVDFNIRNLNKLLSFHLNLEKLILNREKFKEIKTKYFYRNYIKSIKFRPAFRNFGLGLYFLYIRPFNIKDIDFKLLFINNFQKVRYPAYIDNTKSLFIKYIFPYRNPNMAYVNWLTSSKNAISEYCLFYVKRIYQIFHTDNNLTATGWDLDANRFKTYTQKILFDPKFNIQVSKIKEFNIGDLNISNYFGLNSSEYNDLIEIYGLKATDIKSILGTKRHALEEKITNLIRKRLIFPYIKLKNLDLRDKVYVILPSVKKEQNDTIIKIFSFFNFGYIYEIEGEYFIYGFVEKKKFENGLFIKLYLPSSDFSDFQRIFDSLLQHLNIRKYLILNDMIDGINLIKSIYGDLNFLESYNPLKNLKWNRKDNLWRNFKLFGENFEKHYPI